MSIYLLWIASQTAYCFISIPIYQCMCLIEDQTYTMASWLHIGLTQWDVLKDILVMTSQTQRESDYWTHKKLDHDWAMTILPKSTRSLSTLPRPYQTYSHETHIKQSHFHNAKIHVQEFHAFFLLLQSCSPWWICDLFADHILQKLLGVGLEQCETADWNHRWILINQDPHACWCLFENRQCWWLSNLHFSFTVPMV